MTPAVGNGRLGHAVERDGAGHRHAGRVDGSGILAAMIESEDPVAVRVVHDGVGPSADLYLAGGLERLQVEHGDGVVASVAGEAPTQRRDHRDPVNTGRISSSPTDFSDSVSTTITRLPRET